MNALKAVGYVLAFCVSAILGLALVTLLERWFR